MNYSKPEKALISIVIFILFVIVNFVSFFAINSYLNISIYGSDYKAEQKRFIKSSTGIKVHPFYGLASAEIQGPNSNISAEKSFYRISPKKSKKSISVLVLGGSVAGHLSMAREDISKEYMLANELNSRFNTDRFVVYNAAFGGGKQPQQYFKLLYLELLGFIPDIIINYDGFNEVALPFGENLEREINAIYPRSFDQAIVSSSYSGGCFPVNNWLLSFNTYLPITELTKWIFVKYCHNKATGSKQIIKLNTQELILQEQSNYWSRVQLIWSESSNMIARNANINKIPYIHVLQPNQYLVGSKPLSSLEIEKFYNYDTYKKPIGKYYGTLSMDLLSTPNKVDQRYLFESENRTVYSDQCCHFNRLGMSMIIDNLIDETQPIFQELFSN